MTAEKDQVLPNTRAKTAKGYDIFLVTIQCDSPEQAEAVRSKVADLMFQDAITGRSRVKQLTLRRMNWFKRLSFLGLWKKYEVLKVNG